MGDPSHEPSMEEILASIKRIIAEDGEGAPGRKPRSPRPTRVTAEPEDDGVLELTQRVDEPVALAPAVPEDRAPPEPEPAPATAAASEEQDVMPQPEAEAMPEPEATPVADTMSEEQPLMSGEALAASRQSIAQLSQLIVKPDVPGPGTLEALVRDMLRPMLKEWLDARLPDLVDQAVRREIARIAEQR